MEEERKQKLIRKLFPQAVAEEAKQHCQQKHQRDFQASVNSKLKSNVLLDNVPNTQGFTLRGFLCLLKSGFPVGRFREGNIVHALDTRMERLTNTEHDYSPEMEQDRTEILIFLRRAVQDPEYREKAIPFLKQKAGQLNRCICICLGSGASRNLISEVCITVTVLARKLRFAMFDGFYEVITALVRNMALAMAQWDAYVEIYRDARERHADLEMARGCSLVFHPPALTLTYSETNHRSSSMIYFTLTDLMFSLPSPRIFHFFEMRIFRRKEMTRLILFNILLTVVTYIQELQAEALKLMPKPVEGDDDEVEHYKTYRERICSEAQWYNLPAQMYTETVRVYNDKNRINKGIILEIMSVLRNAAPEKLPIFEEATLKMLDLYGGGRIAETYQIGGMRNPPALGVGLPAHISAGELPQMGSLGRSPGGLFPDKAATQTQGQAENQFSCAANQGSTVKLTSSVPPTSNVTSSFNVLSSPATTANQDHSYNQAKAKKHSSDIMSERPSFDSEMSDLSSWTAGLKLATRSIDRKSDVAPKLLELFAPQKAKLRVGRTVTDNRNNV